MDLNIAEVATMIGDPVRAKILWALLDGRAYTATELALVADTSPQNASIHLSKLVHSEFLVVAKQGRHRYYFFAGDHIAYAVEALANLVPPNRIKNYSENSKSGVNYCRTCYDHLAGRIGVLINEALIRRHLITATKNSYEISQQGMNWFSVIGIDVQRLREKKRVFAKPCLDWSERRYHLAGALGAALLDSMLTLDWIRKVKNSRAIVISSKGQKELSQKLGIVL